MQGLRRGTNQHIQNGRRFGLQDLGQEIRAQRAGGAGHENVGVHLSMLQQKGAPAGTEAIAEKE